jgi:hypothetical protein
MIILKILLAWTILSIIAGIIMAPLLARRFAKHNQWVEKSRSDRSAV